MQILLAVDKFKDSLTAKEVITSISNGILKVDANVKIDSLVLSDGGDGFLEAVQSNISNLQLCKVSTINALGHPIIAHYGYEYNSKTAYVELALSSGIAQLSQSERNALKTSTFGTGLVLKEAILKGAKTVYVGLGGSATNDGGCGIAAALGYTFLNKVGEGFIPTAHNLGNIVEIIPPANSIDCQIYAVNDVKNPLLGKNGATYTYGPQ
ncbi:MAG: glycerate kinase, partial [Flavobacteriaceae bacterium]|nr:glycerate kinase [Flavobacteriaceae bacterium]